jgi:hypothetical protein
MYENVAVEEMPKRTGRVQTMQESTYRNVDHSSRSLPANIRPFKYKKDVVEVMKIEHESFFSPLTSNNFFIAL